MQIPLQHNATLFLNKVCNTVQYSTQNNVHLLTTVLLLLLLPYSYTKRRIVVVHNTSTTDPTNLTLLELAANRAC